LGVFHCELLLRREQSCLDERASRPGTTRVRLQCVWVAPGDPNKIQLSEGPERFVANGEFAR
jgi:hypothetical protein